MHTLRVLLVCLLLSAGASAETIRVAAAISLKEAVEEIAKKYEADTSDKVIFTFGSSGQLLSQITSGADVDAFISAANTQVDELTKAGLAMEGSRRIVAGNSLVLIVPADAKESPNGFDALADASVKKVSIGEPKTVPAGQYAMQVLTRLNLADKLKDRLVYGANVRQVLAYVERAEVSAGIVYSTDAKESGDKVKIVATADAQTHEPIVYPAVIIKTSKKQDAAKHFLDYLATEKAKAVLSDKGFIAGGAIHAGN
ncbi:MAG TPA: molybdate ABC transporter substrate-binding protein [Tepidisphaeraceae bacterium]|nr:molybdate ABC transporter substrate-binding protein [Tepidisphaeraceae bacterium]